MNGPAIEPGRPARAQVAVRLGRGLPLAALALGAALAVKMAGVGWDIAWLMIVAVTCGVIIGALLTLEYVVGDRCE